MRNSICKLGATIIIVFYSSFLFSNEDDNLSLNVKRLTGQSQLKDLAKLVQSEVYSDNPIPLIDNLASEATKQENSRFLLCSYNFRIMYYSRNYNQDSIRKYIELSAPLLAKLEPTDDFVAHNELLKNIDYTDRGLFNLALINQKRYLERIENVKNVNPEIFLAIYGGFGDIYYHLERYEEALQYFNKVKDLAKKTNSKSINHISILCLVALCEVNLGNYSRAIESCESAINLINENEEDIAIESRESLKSITNLIVIQAYAKLKEFGKAKVLVTQLLANLDSPIYQEPEAYCYHSLYVYYSGINQYEEALKYTDLGIDHLKKNNNTRVLPKFIKEKALLLYNIKDYKSAFDELLYFTDLTDSIRNTQYRIQLDELAVMYEVNLKDAEIERTNSQLQLTRTIIIAFVVGFILLSILLLVIGKNSRKQKVKNRALFKQQEELNKSIDYYKKIIIEDVNIDSQSSADSLFLKLEKYMLEGKAYKDPNITREDIISALNTNRQYLSISIKEATGLTLVSYINKCRLEHARKLLLKNEDVLIDDIILESGFSSRPTFYRLFKMQYGMPPNEFKQIAVAMQDEINDEKENLL